MSQSFNEKTNFTDTNDSNSLWTAGELQREAGKYFEGVLSSNQQEEIINLLIPFVTSKKAKEEGKNEQSQDSGLKTQEKDIETLKVNQLVSALAKLHFEQESKLKKQNPFDRQTSSLTNSRKLQPTNNMSLIPRSPLIALPSPASSLISNADLFNLSVTSNHLMNQVPSSSHLQLQSTPISLSSLTPLTTPIVQQTSTDIKGSNIDNNIIKTNKSIGYNPCLQVQQPTLSSTPHKLTVGPKENVYNSALASKVLAEKALPQLAHPLDSSSDLALIRSLHPYPISTKWKGTLVMQSTVGSVADRNGKLMEDECLACSINGGTGKSGSIRSVATVFDGHSYNNKAGRDVASFARDRMWSTIIRKHMTMVESGEAQGAEINSGRLGAYHPQLQENTSKQYIKFISDYNDVLKDDELVVEKEVGISMQHAFEEIAEEMRTIGAGDADSDSDYFIHAGCTASAAAVVAAPDSYNEIGQPTAHPIASLRLESFFSKEKERKMITDAEKKELKDSIGKDKKQVSDMEQDEEDDDINEYIVAGTYGLVTANIGDSEIYMFSSLPPSNPQQSGSIKNKKKIKKILKRKKTVKRRQMKKEINRKIKLNLKHQKKVNQKQRRTKRKVLIIRRRAVLTTKVKKKIK